MITFIEIKKFKHLSNLSFPLKGKMNVIFGENGVGKTSIKEAIEFVLTGKVNGKKPYFDCYVSCNIFGQKIVRKYIMKREKIMTGALEVTQHDIDNIIGLNYLQFKSSFSLDFMKMDDEDRHSILLSIFPPALTCRELALDFYKNYHKDSFKESDIKKFQLDYELDNQEFLLKQIDKKLKSLKGEYDFARGELVATIENLNNIGEIGKEKKENLESKKKQMVYEKNIKRLNESKYPYSIELCEKLKIKPFDFVICDHQIKKIEESLTSIKTSISKLNSLKDICPTCGQKTKEVNWKKIEKEKLLLTKELNEMNKKLSNVTEEKRIEKDKIENAIEQKIEKLENKLNLIKEENDLIESENKLISYKKEELKKLKNKQEALEEKIQSYNYDFEEEFLSFVKKIPLEQMKTIQESFQETLGKGYQLILLEKNQTNDNYKKVFKLYKNDIEYNFLSTGQKIYVDIAIARTILKDKKFKTIFIDNSESYTKKISKGENDNTQYICAAARKVCALKINEAP